MANFDEMREQLELLSDEELLSILRERDEEQWRPEVFDIVGSILSQRGVSPGKGSEQEEVIPDETAGMDLVTVASYFNYMDAETDRLALEAKGLQAWVLNKYDTLTESAPPGIQLQVRPEDLGVARGILETEAVPSSDLPPEIAEPPCPRCGSRNVTEEAEIVESPSSSGRLSPKQIWIYRCSSCSHKWSA